MSNLDPRPRRPTLLARTAMLFIRVYQRLFAWAPSRCRFWPSCSQYTLEAVEGHGAWRGLTLGVRRIGRCHPWSDGGPDPVPAPRSRPNVCSAHGSGELLRHEG